MSFSSQFNYVDQAGQIDDFDVSFKDLFDSIRIVRHMFFCIV